jgi:hypothetical protein
MHVRDGRLAERRFYLAFILAIFGAVLLGFSRTFFLRPWFPEWVELHAPREPFFLLHGMVTAAWFIALIAQSSLVRAGRVDLHRRLGTVSMGLAAALIAIGTAAAVIAARRPTGFIDVPLSPQSFLLIPLMGLVQFGVFVVLAYARRRDPQSHKRLMLLASFSIIGAAVVRWPVAVIAEPSLVPGFAVADLLSCSFLLPMVAWDLASLRRIHPVTLYGGFALVALVPVTGFLSQSSAWLAVAGRIVEY